ncbi:type I phosphomannose isomerase catalytic subunit [Shigella flexneri]
MQNYAWGSKTALTELYGMENPSSQPMARLSMAHVRRAVHECDATGDIVSLRDVIESDKSICSERPLPNALANCLSC